METNSLVEKNVAEIITYLKHGECQFFVGDNVAIKSINGPEVLGIITDISTLFNFPSITVTTIDKKTAIFSLKNLKYIKKQDSEGGLT